MTFAKQSTAKTFMVGPILDSAGAAKTDEVVGSIKVTKNGTVGSVDAQDTLTHNHTGHYVFVSDGGDFDTLGEVEFTLNSGTNAMSPVKFQVLPANVYDSLVAGTDTLDVAATSIAANAITATAIQDGAITNAKVADDVDVNVKTITAGAITAAAIADAAIDAATFAAGAIDATAIAASALNGKGDWALAATALSTATWTATRAGYLDQLGPLNIPTTLNTIGLNTSAILTDTGTDIPATLATIAGYIDTEVAAIVTTLGVAGAGLTAIPWNAAWDAEVQSECADALTAYDPPTNTEMEARTLAAAAYGTAANQTTIIGYVDCLPATWVTVPTAIENADAVLARDVSNAEPTTSEHSLRFLVLMATEANTDDNAGYLTVYQTNGTTEVGRKTLATDATADPITGVS